MYYCRPGKNAAPGPLWAVIIKYFYTETLYYISHYIILDNIT